LLVRKKNAVENENNVKATALIKAMKKADKVFIPFQKI